jgi:phosphate starvation-inducible protein PhoH
LGGIKGIATITFTSEDIVRHPLVTKIVKAFDRAAEGLEESEG